MVTATICFPHHATRLAAVRSVCAQAGTPVTAKFALSYHTTRQAVVLSTCAHSGNPVTTTFAFPHHVSRQTGLRWGHNQAGCSMTARIAWPHHLARQSFLRWAAAQTGSQATAMIAFPHYFAQQTALRWEHDQAGSPATARLAAPHHVSRLASLRWTGTPPVVTATLRFRNDYHNFITAAVGYRYDWNAICSSSLRYRHGSVVPAGWRIIAKNIETGELLDLGFIDATAKNPVLEDVFLPDGEYEISVLTSSLFWKDAMDGNVRTISVRPDAEFTSLPTIYNLRAAVLDGVTTIRWSANRSEANECVFGVWYAPESPVDTDREPNTTIWYSASMTEYQTSFEQHAPAWAAVAAIKPGNETEKGKVHELYLDWSNIPPRAPDDVMVLDAPLPAFDADVLERPVEDENVGLVF